MRKWPAPSRGIRADQKGMVQPPTPGGGKRRKFDLPCNLAKMGFGAGSAGIGRDPLGFALVMGGRGGDEAVKINLAKLPFLAPI